MLIFAHPKCGKTTALSGLPNNLIIDLEDGSGFTNSLSINVLELAAKELGLIKPKQVLNHPKGPDAVLGILYAIHQELATLEKRYDYISIDTTTSLIEIATHMATIKYKNTVIGKNYTGKDVVMDLPQGGGYMYLWDAFQEILSWFEPYAQKASILVSHTKESSTIKDGRDLSARDISLPGKLKAIVCQGADAIGHLRRVDGSKTVLSFKTDERDMATGARPAHLANQEFVLVEEEPKGSRNFIFHWDKIFLPE